ncbi:extracellular solute-binding protein family 1, partial [mine drainage metagenome]
GTYAVPFENQFYNGFYNKSLFAKAHIATPPRTWSEITSDCVKLKSVGVIPIVYGAQSGSGEFNPVYEWSYLLAGVYPLSSWNGLLQGHIRYSSSAIVNQLSRWHALDTAGCINSNALTDKVAANAFTSGKAAMIFKGSWDAGSFYQSMGSKVGVMLPPYSTS